MDIHIDDIQNIQNIQNIQKEKDKDKKVYGYNSLTSNWHCLECGINMGPNNSRQLCGKYMCLNL